MGHGERLAAAAVAIAFGLVGIGCGNDSASVDDAGSPVLCSRDLGPVDSGTEAEAGPIAQCKSGWSCVPFGGSWECCIRSANPPLISCP
jgi:hypothetical protein